MANRCRAGKIDRNISFFVEKEQINTINVTLTAYGKDYTKTVSNDGAATRWIEQQVRDLKK